jgi:GT2 family glycosyltransferase
MAMFNLEQLAPKASPLISVLIVNYNGMRYLRKCLESIENQTYRNFEITIIDNASSDGSVDYVHENFSKVRLVVNEQNFGYAKAANQAEENSEGECLFFLNMDTWLEPSVLDVLVSRIQRDSSKLICGCTQLSYDSKQHLNSGLTTDFLGYPIGPVEGKGILYADGASMFVTRSAFESLGGFDPRYFAYGEEVDFCWRALISGYDVVNVAAARVRHNTGGTAIRAGQVYEVKRFRRYLYERNSLRTVLKNYSSLTLVWVLPIRIMVMLYEIGFLTLTRHEAFATDVVRAIMWNLRNFKETITLRCLIQSRRMRSDQVVKKRMGRELAIVRALIDARRNASGIVWK